LIDIQLSLTLANHPIEHFAKDLLPFVDDGVGSVDALPQTGEKLAFDGTVQLGGGEGFSFATCQSFFDLGTDWDQRCAV
jgi:hypothetical protein